MRYLEISVGWILSLLSIKQHISILVEGPWIERRRPLNDIAVSVEEALDRALIARVSVMRPS